MLPYSVYIYDILGITLPVKALSPQTAELLKKFLEDLLLDYARRKNIRRERKIQQRLQRLRSTCAPRAMHVSQKNISKLLELIRLDGTASLISKSSDECN